MERVRRWTAWGRMRSRVTAILRIGNRPTFSTDYEASARTTQPAAANPNAPVLQLWGSSNAPFFDIPAPADYDGDGKADIAVWRRDGTWFVLRSSNSTNLIVTYGQNGDVPVPAKGVW